MSTALVPTAVSRLGKRHCPNHFHVRRTIELLGRVGAALRALYRALEELEAVVSAAA